MSVPPDAVSTGGPPWAPGYRHLTAGVPSVSFRTRERPEDFFVEELPHAPAAGEGTHLLLTVEKRALSTTAAVRRLAAALGRRDAEFGYAGRKDARAVARQRISIEHADPARLRALDVPGLTLLGIERTTRKLRLGDLAGNRFRIVLRGLGEGERGRVEEVLDVLRRRGLPNWVGAQRFGRAGQAWELGRALVAGDPEAYVAALVSAAHAEPSAARSELERVLAEGSWSERRGLASLARDLEPDLARLARQAARRPKDAASMVRAIPRATRRFHVSALQSRVFNRVLARRLAEGAWDAAEAGDVVRHHATGSSEVVGPGGPSGRILRSVGDLAASPTGPLPGRRRLAHLGRPARWERAAVEEEGLDLDALLALGDGLAPGGDRRPLRIPLGDVSLSFREASCTLGFVLPPGSFATAVLEELAKDHGEG